MEDLRLRSEVKACYGKPSLWRWYSARTSIYNKVTDYEYGHVSKDVMLQIVEIILNS